MSVKVRYRDRSYFNLIKVGDQEPHPETLQKMTVIEKLAWDDKARCGYIIIDLKLLDS